MEIALEPKQELLSTAFHGFEATMYETWVLKAGLSQAHQGF